MNCERLKDKYSWEHFYVEDRRADLFKSILCLGSNYVYWPFVEEIKDQRATIFEKIFHVQNIPNIPPVFLFLKIFKWTSSYFCRRTWNSLPQINRRKSQFPILKMVRDLTQRTSTKALFIIMLVFGSHAMSIVKKFERLYRL